MQDYRVEWTERLADRAEPATRSQSVLLLNCYRGGVMLSAMTGKPTMSKTWPRWIIGSVCAVAGCVMSMPAFAQTATTIFSTYIGGSTDQDSVRDVDIDSSGNFYLTGGSSSPDFPVMPVTLALYQIPFDQVFSRTS